MAQSQPIQHLSIIFIILVLGLSFQFGLQNYNTPTSYQNTSTSPSPSPSPSPPTPSEITKGNVFASPNNHNSTTTTTAPPSLSYSCASPAATVAMDTDTTNLLGAPIKDMTNAQIKEELKAHYSADFADCLDRSDLLTKLATVRDTQPITHGLRYGPYLEIGNKKTPTGIVTLAHGLGDSAHGWEDVGEDLARRLPYLLFLLPTAPNRPVTINGGMPMPAWYDIKSMISSGLRSGQQDSASLFQSADYVRSMAHVAARRYKVNPRRVVYAGFSQGAATSIVTALTAHLAPAGAAIMSGYFAGLNDTLPKVVNRDVPFHFFHGSADNVVPLQACKDSIEALTKEAKLTAPIAFKEYRGMMHSVCPEEINDLESFLRKVLPEKQSNNL